MIRLLPNLDDVGLRIRSWTRRGDQEKRVRSAQAKLESGVLAKGGLSKTHRDYWIQRIFKPTYSRHGATVAGRNWCVEIQHRGKRQRWSLGTPNKGRRPTASATFTYPSRPGGWGGAFAEYRPKMAARKPNATVRDLLTEIRATADISPKHQRRLLPPIPEDHR